MNNYILNKEGEPEPVADILEWAKWFEQSGQLRIVKKTKVGKYEVSTVFLSLDHNWGEGPPILWETMIFGDGELDQEQDRCSGSREQAEAMHAKMVDWVQKVEGI